MMFISNYRTSGYDVGFLNLVWCLPHCSPVQHSIHKTINSNVFFTHTHTQRKRESANKLVRALHSTILKLLVSLNPSVHILQFILLILSCEIISGNYLFWIYLDFLKKSGKVSNPSFDTALSVLCTAFLLCDSGPDKLDNYYFTQKKQKQKTFTYYFFCLLSVNMVFVLI